MTIHEQQNCCPCSNNTLTHGICQVIWKRLYTLYTHTLRHARQRITGIKSYRRKKTPWTSVHGVRVIN
jgi:hypothetical protein